MAKFSMLMTGDIILGDESEHYFSGVAQTLEQADVVLGQLEVPYSDRAPELQGLSRSPEALSPLKQYVDALTLAGNHLYDAGSVGVLDTMDYLRRSGIPYTSAGEDLVSASEPVILERFGVKIGYIGYNCTGPKATWAAPGKPGCPYVEIITQFDMQDIANPGGPPERILTWPEPSSFARMQREIAQLRRECDVLCVYFHKGIVHKPVKLADYETIVAHAAVDAGADVVTSSHSHILHGIEVYKGKTIYHGLNNFIAWVPSLRPDFRRQGGTNTALFNPEEWAQKRVERFGFVPDPEYPTYPFHPDAIYTCAAKCYVEDGKIVKTAYVPMIVGKDGVTRTVTRGNGAEAVYDYMERITRQAGLNADFAWDGDEITITEAASI
ncbi:MAG: CapA family protein [Firmicutes bacterium]|nr:CapA family protein [Bacillota bacterium]